MDPRLREDDKIRVPEGGIILCKHWGHPRYPLILLALTHPTLSSSSRKRGSIDGLSVCFSK